MDKIDLPAINTTLEAFLLTRQWRDTAKGIVLDLWFASQQGACHVLIEKQQAIFFIRQQDHHLVQQLLSPTMRITIKALQLKNFDHQAVSGVYFTRQRDLYQARTLLQEQHIKHYEADIRPTERYLMERFLTGAVTIEPTEASVSEKIPKKPLLINPKISPHRLHKPKLTIMSLDIETAYDSQELYCISMLCEHWQISLIKADTKKENIKNTTNIECFLDEKSLMLRFIELMLTQDPDIIIGWNVINFDFRFLQKKADSLHLSLAIGRAQSLPVWRKAQTEQEHFFLLIPGRVVLDGIETLKSATWNFPSFSLESVAQNILGRGKKIAEKEHIMQVDSLYKAKEIKRQYQQDKAALIAYNIEDCQLVWDIFKQTQLLEFALQRAQLTGLEMDRTGGSVAAFDNLYLPRLHRKGFVAPNIFDHKETFSAPGGYVMNSKPGFYQSVLVLDYKSLYPAIIRTFGIDPYARIIAESLDKQDCIPGFNGISFARDDTILPEIIEHLWQARDQAKKESNKTLSQAIKIIMNSFYGVLGTSGCRVHDARLTSAITLRGHELMKKTALLIEEEGYDVIYGDTDSVFVSLGGLHHLAQKQSIETQATQADSIGHALVAKINHYWQHTLAEQYQIDSALEMEYEVHYSKFFMPTIRGSTKGSKKRYAGMIQDKTQKTNDKIIFKGLESVRTDWTELAREVQQEIYQRIFHERPYKEYLKNIVLQLKQGQLDHKLIYKKRLRQALSEYKKNCPPHAQAAIKAQNYIKEKELKKNEAQQSSDQTTSYQQGSWIHYFITKNGAEPAQYNTYALDYDHYIEKQIAPVVDALLMVFDSSLEKIIQTQYELF